MKFKDASTSDLIKISENIHDEIKKDVLNAFGVDLTCKELVHHDRAKPVWTQKIRDNRSLKKELDSFLGMVRNNLAYLPDMMLFEKEHPDAISENYSRDSISYDLEFLWICESHLDKFQKDNYLAKKEIENYRNEISDMRDKIREIASRANLS